MYMEELLSSVEKMIDPSKTWTVAEEAQLTELIAFAGEKAKMKRYPFGTQERALPDRYGGVVARIAVELYNKIGAEGQISHSENGINRAWESADDARALLEYIPSVVGVCGLANHASE